jgi:Tfp pilus assembly protein PilO
MKTDNKLVRILKDFPFAVLSVVVILICAIGIFLRGGIALELTAKEADLNARIRTIDQNVKNAKDLGQDVEEVELLVEQIEARLFNRDQRAVNINFFYAMEDRLNVRIANISQAPMEDPLYAKGGVRELNLHSTIGYNLSVTGKFEDILIFLYELDRVEPMIRVADFQIAKGNTMGADESLEARLRLTVLAEK